MSRSMITRDGVLEAMVLASRTTGHVLGLGGQVLGLGLEGQVLGLGLEGCGLDCKSGQCILLIVIIITLVM